MTRRPPPRPRHRLARLRTSPAATRGLDGELQALREQPSPDSGGTQALVLENTLLLRELGRVQRRCTQWHDDAARRVERLEAQLVRIVQQTQLCILRETLDDLRQRSAVLLTNETLQRRLADLRARNRALEAELAELAGGRASAATDAPPLPVPLRHCANDEPAADGVRLHGRRVLCVGGRGRQMPLYQALVEERGGRFAQVGGADGADLAQLRRALADADLVVLQPRYVCQAACRLVEVHCASAGIRCVQLDKCCLPGFAGSLATAVLLASPSTTGLPSTS